MFDNKTSSTFSVVSLQPMVRFKCSAGGECSETEVDNTSVAMLDDQGKCSALLAREGFFDFVIFRTQCDRSFPVSLVCQHKPRTIVFNNDLSDIKVTTVDGFYSLRAFSSCDLGWFMVDNMCINIYQCAQCKANNSVAHEQCVKHGAYLANRIFQNITIINSSEGYMLNLSSTLSMSFWNMLFYESYFREVHKQCRDHHPRPRKTNFAMNRSILCATHTHTLCQENRMVLAVTQKYHCYDAFGPTIIKGPFSITFQSLLKTNEPNYALCEKPRVNTEIVTNCSNLYMDCDDGTCVHDSLVCDGKPHCLHGEDEADCERICSDNTASCMSQCHHRELCSCSQEYFQCLSGGCVPLQKLCDQTVHCSDASDEPPTCVYVRPEQLGTPSMSLDINHYINDLIHKNTPIQQACFKDEFYIVTKVNYTIYARQKVCSPSYRSHDMKLSCCSSWSLRRSNYKCSTESGTQQYPLDHLCVYDHDCNDENVNHCVNGFHLKRCEHAYCVGRFKCPSSYCISFNHICNKVCDCLHCEDENICSKLLCPGTVLTEQMGSGFKCSRDIVAVKHSMNLRQIIRRKELNITDDLPVFIYLEGIRNLTNLIEKPEIVAYCQILHSNVSMFELMAVVRQMPSVRRLILQHNNIQEVDAPLFASMSLLLILDLSYNLIQYLPKFIFCSSHNLEYISLHHNLILSLRNNIFIYTPNIQVLLLESNNIDPQSVTIDISLPLLYRLSSDIPRLCCGFETVPFCTPTFSLIISCLSMITSALQIALAWITGLSTSLLNLLCAVLLVYHCFTVDNDRIGDIMIFSINLSLAELVTSACL